MTIAGGLLFIALAVKSDDWIDVVIDLLYHIEYCREHIGAEAMEAVGSLLSNEPNFIAVGVSDQSDNVLCIFSVKGDKVSLDS